jgi:osmoprotectant transport system permease protein
VRHPPAVPCSLPPRLARGLPQGVPCSLSLCISLCISLCFALFPSEAGATPLRVGSKRFTESYVLAELAVQSARAAGEPDAQHVEGLGGTAIVFRALEDGGIDLYPEYTGTLAEAVLGGAGADLAALRRALLPRGIEVGEPLGFSNTYAIAVAQRQAEARGLRRLSDLGSAADLRLGLSHEFIGRSDGWLGLAARYGLAPARVDGMDHGLAYEALASGSIDALDVYSTDAKIARYHLRVLEDDRGYFPPYEAVFVYRAGLQDRHPRAFARIAALSGTLTEASMIALNGRVELDGLSFAEAAAERLGSARGPSRERGGSFVAGLLRVIAAEGPRHLWLTSLSLLLSALVGLPLGVAGSRSRALGRALVSATGALQTIPALALLCFLIPLFGTGPVPAVIALFLYGLLPIVRNTTAALRDLPPSLLESAEALGLSPWSRLRRVELPMASRLILAGIKTSAVINVGTATLAAFIGAGGFGQPISTGLNLNDTRTILQGAVPAALLALGVEGLFGLADRWVVPAGLRQAGE